MGFGPFFFGVNKIMLNKRADKLELLRIAEAVALEKSIDKELIISSMETGIAKAAKSKFGQENEIKVSINRENGDFKLDNSPGIGQGSVSYVLDGDTLYAPKTDLLGNLRPDPNGSNPDIGAYENTQSAQIVYPVHTVKKDGTGDYTTIQAALNASSVNDTITVYPGTFKENIIISKGVVLRSSEGYRSTILDGGGNGKTVKIIETTNLEGLQVIGFTIQNGFAEYTGSTDRGGGMEISSADKTVIISDCYFTNNRSDKGGAHIKIDGDNVFINRSIFVNGLGGTPIFSDNGRKSGYFTNCLIDANGEAHVVDGNSFPDFY